MRTKKAFFIVFVFFLSNVLIAQDNFPSAELVSNDLNRGHPLYEILIKKDKQYINWLYFHCKGPRDKHTLKSPMSSPLIFSIKQEDSIVVQDTISNCVHPKLYEDERELEWQSEIPLYGNFPKNVFFHLTNDPKIGASIDLSIHRESSDIKMYVLTEEGDLVSKIIDKRLKQGSYKFFWHTTAIKTGTYLLFTEVEGHLTIHPLTVEKNWFTNLFSRDSEVSRKKRVVRFSFEEANMPRPKGEFQYVRKNRFGTAVGLNLLVASIVKIKLFSITGDYISTLNYKKLNTGESEFLLNKHIEKTGWYLIQLTINGKRKHLKIKIKK